MTYKLWQLFVLAGVPAVAAAAVLAAHNRPGIAPPTRDAIVERTSGDYREGAAADAADARTNLRAAVPALEAYHADTGAYRGVTAARLRAKYDARVRAITVVHAGTSYCVESTVGSATFHKDGPGAGIANGHCP